MNDPSIFTCPYIDKKVIWDKADTFRHSYWPEQLLPIDIEKIIEERLNLNIEPMHNIHKDHDIDAYLRLDMTGIIVDNDIYMDERYTNRLRFSLTHEIGHLSSDN